MKHVQRQRPLLHVSEVPPSPHADTCSLRDKTGLTKVRVQLGQKLGFQDRR